MLALSQTQHNLLRLPGAFQPNSTEYALAPIQRDPTIQPKRISVVPTPTPFQFLTLC